jgi:hypothetical protein
MLSRFSETIRKYTNGWIIRVLLAGEVIFNALILPQQGAKIKAISG